MASTSETRGWEQALFAKELAPALDRLGGSGSIPGKEVAVDSRPVLLVKDTVDVESLAKQLAREIPRMKAGEEKGRGEPVQKIWKDAENLNLVGKLKLKAAKFLLARYLKRKGLRRAAQRLKNNPSRVYLSKSLPKGVFASYNSYYHALTLREMSLKDLIHELIHSISQETYKIENASENQDLINLGAVSPPLENEKYICRTKHLGLEGNEAVKVSDDFTIKDTIGQFLGEFLIEEIAEEITGTKSQIEEMSEAKEIFYGLIQICLIERLREERLNPNDINLIRKRIFEFREGLIRIMLEGSDRLRPFVEGRLRLEASNPGSAQQNKRIETLLRASWNQESFKELDEVSKE